MVATLSRTSASWFTTMQMTGSGESEVTEAKSFDVVTVGINNLPPEVKLSIMNPYTCDIDAEIADQIVQTGLFGSPVYG